jgi:hypothetical protein
MEDWKTGRMEDCVEGRVAVGVYRRIHCRAPAQPSTTHSSTLPFFHSSTLPYPSIYPVFAIPGELRASPAPAGCLFAFLDLAVFNASTSMGPGNCRHPFSVSSNAVTK